eukprot:c35351_g1_i1 orf=84-236(-)
MRCKENIFLMKDLSQETSQLINFFTSRCISNTHQSKVAMVKLMRECKGIL